MLKQFLGLVEQERQAAHHKSMNYNGIECKDSRRLLRDSWTSTIGTAVLLQAYTLKITQVSACVKLFSSSSRTFLLC